ncbi:plasmid stabilization protein [Vibrio parahaemolyticus]|uniref:type II toxin-antitoxin system RelE/ParE family toxin n=1 Tax=Vibrio parahaemolyticus TaxID=670 RepID=UPI0003F8BEFC|nr:type II toxin-antitoxin system RelE/ParE family toxin [Vibrio parahaemolyticus]ELN6894066.1 type II toxin-antitoxin system RelE/ParE family toxin [Vibrio cholerae]EIK4811112.1 type II toxin-antitoxin system RelE/ParE family toxin [Vibrio parahaemolyticus]EKC5524105.1 type II toxin-antitoxin system RelE/ParE family toxin [Vibrio parahaemolyticus]KKC79438.1 plasmid stabilization protein [Vibrio parahaemolyticus]KKX76974.1 plasmid stabilization protein [Vibrio parahaemolyticus]
MYKLSNLAAKDFEQIFEYTLLNFGIKQADVYTDSINDVLLTLAEQPLMGYECTEIAEGLRRHDHNKHAIYYRTQSHGIYIIRILHQKMKPLLHLPSIY